MTNKEVIEAYTKTKESLNPILDELQEMNGFVSSNDIIEIAKYLDTVSYTHLTLPTNSLV